LEVGASIRSLLSRNPLTRRRWMSLQMSSQMRRPDSTPWAPSKRSPAQSKRRTQCLPRSGGRMRQTCRLPHSTLGASPSARPTASGRSVILPPRSDVAGHLGASQNAEPRCTRAVAVGALVVLFLEAARAGAFIQAGARAPSVVFTTQVSSAMATARCIAATTTGTSWIAPLAPSPLGGVDESVGD